MWMAPKWMNISIIWKKSISHWRKKLWILKKGSIYICRISGLVMNPRYPGYPNTRVFLPHFSPRYPEVNTRVVWVVDFWPNLHVFSIFFTKSSEILCDYSYMIFSKSYNQVQIQNCQKIVPFWGKKILNSNF